MVMAEPRIITPGGGPLGMPDQGFFKAMKDKVPRGIVASVPFVLYLKNAQQIQFILEAKLLFEWDKDILMMRTVTNDIVPKHWDRLFATKKK